MEGTRTGHRVDKANKVNRTAICTDSLSLLLALEHNNPEISNLRSKLEDLSCTVDLLYVPGHKDIAGNELADKYAKEAAGSEGDYAENSIPFKTAKSIIKQEVKDGPILHPRTAACYTHVSHKKDRQAVKTEMC